MSSTAAAAPASSSTGGSSADREAGNSLSHDGRRQPPGQAASPVVDGWPGEVLAAFASSSEPITWNMGQTLAARVCRAARIPYGRQSKVKHTQFEHVMLEMFGPGWKAEAKANEELAIALAAVARAESQRKLAEDTEHLLVALEPRS